MRLNVKLSTRSATSVCINTYYQSVLKFRERVVGECSKEKIGAARNLEEKYNKNMFYIRYP